MNNIPMTLPPKLPLPNAKSTKHRLLYEKLNQIVAFLEEKFPNKKLEIIPSPRIDWCGDCQMEHGFDCPKEGDHIQCSGGRCECKYGEGENEFVGVFETMDKVFKPAKKFIATQVGDEKPKVERYEEVICKKCMAHYSKGFEHICPPWMLAIKKTPDEMDEIQEDTTSMEEKLDALEAPSRQEGGEWDIGGDIGIQVAIMLDKTLPNKYSSSFLEIIEQKVADIVNPKIKRYVDLARAEGFDRACAIYKLK